MPKEGIFAKVIRPGILKSGDYLEYLPRKLKVGVVTLSNREYNGIYADLSGPQIISMMEIYSKETGWLVEFDYHLIPDDKDMLSALLTEMITDQKDLIFTTGEPE